MTGRYLELTKYRLVANNLLTALGGFALASKGTGFDWVVCAAVIVGLACIMGGSAVFNNVIDRDIDSVMKRTQGRALVRGDVSLRRAIILGGALVAGGGVVMFTFANPLAGSIALMWFVAYVILYSMWWKRTRFGVHVGTLSGVVPPIAGYAAASGSLDTAAATLFLILATWQVPHFYAIAIYRLNDYAKTGIPLLPLTSGIWTTKVHTILYIVACTLAVSLPTVIGRTGLMYLFVSLALCIWWLALATRGLFVSDDISWGRAMFRLSLIVNVGVFVMMIVDSLLLLP